MLFRLLFVILISLSLRLLIISQVNNILIFNPDEARNYEIAYNQLHGKGYTVFDPDAGVYKLTSFHSSFPVFLYQFLIKNNISTERFIFFNYVVFFIVFSISVLFFYRLAFSIFRNTGYSFWCTVTYAFYPSIIFYIGSLAFYENFVMPMLIINIWILINAFKNGFRKIDYCVIPISVCISCLFRPQVIAVYSFVFMTYFIYNIFRRRYKLLPILGLTVLISVIAYIPAFVKNKKMFGEYVISTQSGFELLQGHNPLARGSWRGQWDNKLNIFYEYVHHSIPNIDKMNELEESKMRKQLAFSWMLSHPFQELILDLRKIAIFFLPRNFEILITSNFNNPINFFVHILFLGFVLARIIKKKLSRDELIIIGPILGSIILCLIFFVGYRWRYYAEPFMIIFAWKFISILNYRLGAFIEKLKHRQWALR